MSFSFGGSKSKSSSTSTSTNPYAVKAYESAAAGLPSSYTPLSGTAYQKYINPFTSDVIGNLQSQYAKTREQTQNAVDDSAIAAGAFGGSRNAIQSGVADAEGQANLNNTIAQFLANQFNIATQTAQSENQDANSYPLQKYALLGSLAGNTQQDTKSSGKGSGSNFGLSYTYGGK